MASYRDGGWGIFPVFKGLIPCCSFGICIGLINTISPPPHLICLDCQEVPAKKVMKSPTAINTSWHYITTLLLQIMPTSTSNNLQCIVYHTYAGSVGLVNPAVLSSRFFLMGTTPALAAGKPSKHSALLSLSISKSTDSYTLQV